MYRLLLSSSCFGQVLPEMAPGMHFLNDLKISRVSDIFMHFDNTLESLREVSRSFEKCTPGSKIRIIVHQRNCFINPWFMGSWLWWRIYQVLNELHGILHFHYGFSLSGRIGTDSHPTFILDRNVRKIPLHIKILVDHKDLQGFHFLIWRKIFLVK